jgi:hypothetical protein
MNRRRVALVMVAMALFPLGGCSGDGSAGPEDDFTTSDLDPDVAPVTAGTWYRLPMDITWQWQLDGEVNTSYQVDFFDLDCEQPASFLSLIGSHPPQSGWGHNPDLGEKEGRSS